MKVKKDIKIMHNGIFITGTDTDVGKTMVTAGLLTYLRNNSINAIPMKPIQTGCKKTKDGYIVPDLEYSLKISNLKISTPKKALAPYCYEPACSPHLAAELTNHYPNILKIKKDIHDIANIHDYVLIEGAGGIMVPINKTEMMLDLMKEIGFPVVLVARAGLGTINHTLMSIEVLRNAGIHIVGVFINNVLPESKEDEFIRKNNIKAIEKYGNIKILGVIKHQKNTNDIDFVQVFKKSLINKNKLMEFVKNGINKRIKI
jgi:dethiobiotin synthase